jgi:hypothetical protein
VHPEQFFGIETEKQLQQAFAQTENVTARGFTKPCDPAFVADPGALQFFFRLADDAHFRHRIDAVGKQVFADVEQRSAERVTRGMTPLLHRGRSERRETDDIAGSVDVSDLGAIVFIDGDTPAIVDADPGVFDLQTIRIRYPA